MTITEGRPANQARKPRKALNVLEAMRDAGDAKPIFGFQRFEISAALWLEPYNSVVTRPSVHQLACAAPVAKIRDMSMRYESLISSLRAR